MTEVWENGGINQRDLDRNNKATNTQAIGDNARNAVIWFDYKFPQDCKQSGIIYFNGERITQKEFKKLAKEMK